MARLSIVYTPDRPPDGIAGFVVFVPIGPDPDDQLSLLARIAARCLGEAT